MFHNRMKPEFEANFLIWEELHKGWKLYGGLQQIPNWLKCDLHLAGMLGQIMSTDDDNINIRLWWLKHIIYLNMVLIDVASETW